MVSQVLDNFNDYSFCKDPCFYIQLPPNGFQGWGVAWLWSNQSLMKLLSPASKLQLLLSLIRILHPCFLLDWNLTCTNFANPDNVLLSFLNSTCSASCASISTNCVICLKECFACRSNYCNPDLKMS